MSNTYLLITMKTKKRTLDPITVETVKAELQLKSSLENHIDPMNHFNPIIRGFGSLVFSKYFWFVLDFTKWTVHEAGGDIETMAPFKRAEFVGFGHTVLNNATHPEDVNKVYAFSKAWVDYNKDKPSEYIKNLRMSLYFRMMNAEGTYFWIMVQYPEGISNKNGELLFNLVLVTDISHLKKNGRPMMNILDLNKNNCQQFYCNEENGLYTKNVAPYIFTKRQKEILNLIAKGYSSKQIASQLFVSIKTVDNHRQTMLHNTNTKSSSELVVLGIRLGVI